MVTQSEPVYQIKTLRHTSKEANIKELNISESLTGVGSGQVVPGIGLFDDVLVDLVPLTLSITPEHTKGENAGQK